MQLKDITLEQKKLVFKAISFLRANLDSEVKEILDIRKITESDLENLENDLCEVWNCI